MYNFNYSPSTAANLVHRTCIFYDSVDKKFLHLNSYNASSSLTFSPFFFLEQNRDNNRQKKKKNNNIKPTS